MAARIFRGIRAMHESDTFLAILDEGKEKHAKKTVLLPSPPGSSRRRTVTAHAEALLHVPGQATAYSVCFLTSGERKASTICAFGMPA